MSKWEMVNLAAICDLNMGQSPESSSYNQDGDGIPFYQGNADFGELNPQTRFFCNKPTKIAKKDDVLLSVRAPIGALNIATETCCIGRGLAALTAKRNLTDTKFLYYLLKRNNAELNQKGTGSTFKAINKQNLSELLCPHLPLENQKQIAHTLDTAAELLAMRKKQHEELDNLIKSTFYNMFGDPVANEKGWDVKQLSAYCSVNPRKSEIEYFEDNFPVSFIAMQSISANGDIDTRQIRDYKEVKTGFTYFYENDVLFAKITPCMENGKGAIARSLRNNIGFGSTEFHVLRPIKGVSNSEWLYRLTTLPIFRENAEKNMSGSAGQKRVPTSFFNKFKVSLPPFNLQTQFASIVTKIEEQKVLVKKAIGETQYLFDSLMSEYFE